MKTSLLSFFRIGFGAAMLFLALALCPAQAADEAQASDFSIKIEKGKAVISDKSGKVVATVDAGTIAKTLTVGGSSFQVTFGNDASGNLSLSVAASPGTTAPMSFTVNGRKVEVAAPVAGAASGAVVNVTVSSSSGQTTVSTSGGGSVKVDGQVVVSKGTGTGGGAAVDLSNVTSTPADSSGNTALTAASGSAGSNGVNSTNNGDTKVTDMKVVVDPPKPPPLVINLNPAATTPV